MSKSNKKTAGAEKPTVEKVAEAAKPKAKETVESAMLEAEEECQEEFDLGDMDEVNLLWTIDVNRPNRLSDEQRAVLSPMQESVLDYAYIYMLDDRQVEKAGEMLIQNPKRLLVLLEQLTAHAQNDDDLQYMFEDGDCMLLLDLKEFLLSALLNRPEE